MTSLLNLFQNWLAITTAALKCDAALLHKAYRNAGYVCCAQCGYLEKCCRCVADKACRLNRGIGGCVVCTKCMRGKASCAFCRSYMGDCVYCAKGARIQQWRRSAELAYRIDCWTLLTTKLAPLESGVPLSMLQITTLRKLLQYDVVEVICSVEPPENNSAHLYDNSQLTKIIDILYPAILAHFEPEGAFTTKEAAAFQEIQNKHKRKRKSPSASEDDEATEELVK